MTSTSPKTADQRNAPSNANRRRRVLAIDYGRKKMGLALSDELGLTAQPLMIYKRTNRQNDFRQLRQIIRNNHVARIVIGHPLALSGEAGEMADEAKRFACRLQKELGIEVELWDERLTSWAADQTVRETNSSRRVGAQVDDVAAAILLRDYLDRRRADPPAATERD